MLRRTALVFLFLVAGLLATGYTLLRLSLPRVDGEVALPGLSAPVTVERDAQGVPTVRGSNRLDVARVTGFIHAQDRFFQMDLQRRQAAGELSALVGPRALEVDRKQRLHRMRDLAGRTLRGLPANEQALIAAYADGVNAGLAGLKVRPFEYLLLRADPQPWRPEDTALTVHAMFFQLADALAGLEARGAALRDCVPEPVAAFLSGNDAAWAAPVDGGTIDQAPLPGAATYDLRRLKDLDFEPGRSFAATLGADPDFPAGSNSWAVAGSRTRDGRGLVANDMHLKLRVPNIWYRMRLIVDAAAAPLDATGVTLPGTPAIVAGSTGKVAWGFTNSYGDWSDRVLLELEPGHSERYRTPDGYRPFTVHDEIIEVKGGAPATFSARWSIWGPVVNDHRNRPVAIQWLGHRQEATNLALMELEQATGVEQALEIARRSGVPPQNFVVADARGNIGWTIVGRIPLRQGYDSSLPASRADDSGWKGWLPPERYPRIVNPADGLIWTANHQVVTGEALALIGNSGYWHGARARQIRDDLRSLAQPSEKDMLAIQLDDRALLMARWQKLLLSLLTPDVLSKRSRAAEFRETVAAWNGRASADSASYRLVHAFRARVHDTLFAAITAPCRKLDASYLFSGFRQDEGALWTLVEQRPPHLLNPRYPDWDAQLQAIAMETIDYFERGFPGPFADRTWGERNTLAMRHPLSLAVPWLARWLDMASTPMSGDRHVPRVQLRDDGASERFGVAPGHERDGYFEMPGGQSGHPLSPWYRAGHESWLKGEPGAFLPGAPAHTLRFSASASP